ncbi:MAG: hypothetical protein WBD01_09105, partial [Salaquimonas sp.]
LSVYAMYSEASGSVAINPAVDLDLTQLAVGAVWAPVSGLTVQFEYANTETNLTDAPAAAFWDNEVESVSVRVTRSF